MAAKFVGTCGYCGREGFSLKDLKLSQHGYQVPDGFREGPCPGSRQDCLETSDITLLLLEEDIENWLRPLGTQEMTLLTADSLSQISQRYTGVGKDGFENYVEVFEKGTRMFEKLQHKRLSDLRLRREHLMDALQDVCIALSNWKPRSPEKK